MNWVRDATYAVRGWLRAPGFAVAAIATLALGIGANTAIFSVVSGVLLRPLPYVEPDRLARVYEKNGFDGPVVWSDLEQWRAHSKLFEGMAFFSSSSRNLQGNADPEQVATVPAERALFRLLGVPALAGRTFEPGDPTNVAVASYGFWQSRFGGDASAIGRSLMLDGEQFTLLGVMPEDFQFPHGPAATQLWIPWEMPAEYRDRPNMRLDAVLARLKPGVGMEAGRQELSALVKASGADREVRIRPLQDVVSGEVRDSLLVLLGAVGLVLLVACVNVANLLLARISTRAREIAIRSALGAGRLQLMRQFLTESVLLAFAGGAAGMALGLWGSRVLVRIASAQIPRAAEIGFDWRVFLFLTALCALTGIGFGLGPALSAARGGADALRGRSVRSRFRDTLVVVEVGLAFVLLAGAGLLMRTFVNLQRTPPGVQPESVLTAHVVVSGAAEAAALEQRVSQIPGVRAAGLVSLLPLQNSGWSGFVNVPGRTENLPVELRYVTPGYFRAMGIAIRRGHGFTGREPPDGKLVIVVNEAFARQYFPDRDPVGVETSRGVVIGVAGDVRQEKLSTPAKPEVYYLMAQNFAQMRRHGSTLVVKGFGRTEALVGHVRAAVRQVNPGQAVFRVATMREVISESLAVPRLYAWLLGLFAVIGTLLAVAGTYGVIAYLVSQQTRDFGIRMALGADEGNVLRLVLGRGAALVLLGLAIGITGALIVTRVLSGVLYGVGAADPWTFGLMATVLGSAAMAACLVPARRAAAVDPAVALRAE